MSRNSRFTRSIEFIRRALRGTRPRLLIMALLAALMLKGDTPQALQKAQASAVTVAAPATR